MAHACGVLGGCGAFGAVVCWGFLVRLAVVDFPCLGPSCDDRGVWRELIWQMYPEAVLADPVDEVTLAEVEKRLQLPLPFELASLLREVDGVANEYGDAVVWSARRLVEDNLGMRREPDYQELYAPFDEMIFFGDSDMGPQFAYVHTDYGPGIVVWDHESDRRRLVVVSLRDYLARCLIQGNSWFR